MAGAREELARRRAEIAARIEAAFAPRLANAGLLKRFRLRLQMNRQIEREMRIEEEKIAPRDALYVRQ